MNYILEKKYVWTNQMNQQTNNEWLKHWLIIKQSINNWINQVTNQWMNKYVWKKNSLNKQTIQQKNEQMNKLKTKTKNAWKTKHTA